MAQTLISKCLWSLWEDTKTHVTCEEIRGQKIAFDARAWFDDYYSEEFKSDTGKQPKAHFDLKSIFWQLYKLNIDQIEILVVIEQLNGKYEEKAAFLKECISLLVAMSIPYIEVEDVHSAFSNLINEKVVDGCITESPSVFLHGLKTSYRYSDSMTDQQAFQLTRYSTGDKWTSDHIFCFQTLASLILSNINRNLNNNNVSNNNKKDCNKNPVADTVTEPNIRQIRTRACKKPYAISTPLSNKRAQTEKTKLPPANKKDENESKSESSDGKYFPVKEDQDTFRIDAINKLSKVISGWSENPIERLKDIERNSGDNSTTGNLRDDDKELFLLFQDHNSKLFIDESITLYEKSKNYTNNDLLKTAKEIKWEKPHLNILHSYLQSKLSLKLPWKQLLGYIVARDLSQLLSSSISGDSYPEGISRPEKVLKLFKRNDIEMYNVKWLYIPGADDLRQKDLVTTEFKNVFSAAFPKIASKYEGWSLKSSSDDEDDIENDYEFGFGGRVNSPGSPKKRQIKRRRGNLDSVETLASSSGSTKTTMKHFYVARKKLTFDAIK